MPKLGNHEYPDMDVDVSLELAKKIETTFNSKSAPQSAIAETLGHKTDKSGPFQMKLSDLRKYGLIEGRGDVKTTDLTKRLFLHPSDDEYNQAIAELIKNTTNKNQCGKYAIPRNIY